MSPEQRKQGNRSDPSDSSDRSDQMHRAKRINQTNRTHPTDQTTQPHPKRLRTSGGYRKLRSFQTATIIYDATVSFCNRFVDRRSRTHDQMVQAARSGRQNIAEGSRAGATSSKSETHLTNVARASLDELLLDFEDFLRQRHLPQWAKDAPEARKVRALGREVSGTFSQADSSPYTPWLEHADPSVVANTVICLIHQANYLLDRQIAVLERAIIEKGGYREQLTAARLAERGKRKYVSKADKKGPTDPPPPCCPHCGKPMVQRTARQGRTPGASFWGCTDYPDCKGTRPL